MASTPIFIGLLFFFFFFCGKACHFPYNHVGDYCLLIDNDIKGTWTEVRNMCQIFGGDLANLQDANILYEISQYIKSNGMNDVSYWVGATDEAEEGKWIWTSDNTTVRGRTPLWGDLYGQQPDGGVDQNCGVLYVEEFYYMHDEFCDEKSFGLICQPLASEKLKPIGSADEYSNTDNISPNECPFEMIGGACLQVLYDNLYIWPEAIRTCNDSYKHMAKIDDANLLAALYDYFTEGEIKVDFWIGGTDEASENDWVWLDATPVKRGTPFWDVTEEGSQEPDGGKANNCCYLSYSASFFFKDISCAGEHGVICQYDM